MSQLKKHVECEHHSALHSILASGLLSNSNAIVPNSGIEAIKDYLECHPYEVDEAIVVNFGRDLGWQESIITDILYEKDEIRVELKANRKTFLILTYTSSKIRLPKPIPCLGTISSYLDLRLSSFLFFFSLFSRYPILDLGRSPRPVTKKMKTGPSSANPRVFKVYDPNIKEPSYFRTLRAIQAKYTGRISESQLSFPQNPFTSLTFH